MIKKTIRVRSMAPAIETPISSSDLMERSVVVKNQTEAPIQIEKIHSAQFHIPVRYIGIGEGIDQLKMFDRKEFVNALFGSEAK